MRINVRLAITSGLIFGLAACGGGGGGSDSSSGDSTTPPPVIDHSGERGSLVQNPPLRSLSLDTAGLQLQLTHFGPLLGNNAGVPKCGIDFYHFEYGTVGAANEKTAASGALMVPTGTDPACTKPHPVLLYGHGSSLQHNVNMADITSANSYNGTTATIAALYVAQGYIAVAPNYAGYDTSGLNYHSEHIAEQNGKDMIDALTAARKAFSKLAKPVTENGKLFLSGYSEGGYVTMATHRAMQAAGIKVTASVPQSGAYAASAGWEGLGMPGALDDLSGQNLDTRLRYVLQFTAYQKAYGNLYGAPSELYPNTYSAAMETLLPTNLDPSSLVALGLFPPYLLAKDMPNYSGLTPLEQSYYGPPAQSLLNTSYVTGFLADIASNPCPVFSSSAPLDCTPTHPLRIAGIKNDLRTWTPVAPMLICGGHADPDVGFAHAQLTQAYFAAHGTMIPLLDVDSAVTANDPYAKAKSVFLAARQNVIDAGGDPGSVDNYHGYMVSAACNIAARDFFSQF